MEREKVYCFSEDRLNNICMEGFRNVSGRLQTEAEGSIIFPYLDSGENMSSWGRLHIDMELSTESMLSVYVAALSVLPENNNVRKELFEEAGAKVFINKEDMLLYDLEGRYLLVMIVAKGQGRQSIGNIKV